MIDRVVIQLSGRPEGFYQSQSTLDRPHADSYAHLMSDLYRKEALTKRTRALFGEVRLQAPPGSWVVTLLVVFLVAMLAAGLFLIQMETAQGPIRLLDWLLGRGV